MKKRHLIMGFVLGAAAAIPAQPLATWTKYRTITVNTTAGGANVASDVMKFPVLVRLDSVNANDIFTGALTGGADLRFSNSAGTAIVPHEIESWDGVAKKAAIWVLADTVKGNSNAPSLRVYWGKAGELSTSSGAAVFDTANAYIGVWHMNGSTDEPDATVNGNTAVAAGAPGSAAGHIGGARSFDRASSQHFIVADHASLNSVTDAFTLSAWVNATDWNGSSRIFQKGLGTDGNSAQYGMRENSNNQLAIEHNGTHYPGATNSVPATGTWALVHARFDGGSNRRVYLNGAQLFSTNTSTTTTTTNNDPLDIGRRPDGTNYFNGVMDELRVQKAARSSDWIQLEFETQKATVTAVILGATQNIAGPALIRSLAYGDSTKAVDTLTAFQTGVAVNILPTYFGGPVDSFKVVGTVLPVGLSVNKTTGALSGSPSAVTAAANYTVRAWGHFAAGDSVSRTVRLSVLPGGLANFKYNPDTTSYVAGLPIAPNIPTWTGRAPTKFAVSAGTLPAGLVLDTASGRIQGSPSTAAAATNVTIRATNTTGPDTATRVLRLTITAAEDYATWTQRDTLWLNTQTNGAGTTALVRDFPVLVRLDSTAFASVYTQSSGRGADLRFLKGTANVRLPHQIESWDSVGRKAAIWVLIDSVRANDRTQTIRMLWGKPGAPNASSGPSVFDTAKGFRAVFHFNEGAGADSAFDATQYAFKAIPQRTSAANYNFPIDTTGIVARARAFGTGSGASATSNSAGNYFTVAGSAAPLDFAMGGPYTLSTWVVVNEVGTSRTLFSKSDRQYAFERRNTGADWEFTEHNLPLGGWQVVSAPSAVGVWTHLVGVRNNNASALYVDGVLVDTVPNSDATTTARITTTDLNIGRSPDGGTNNAARYYWRGMLDEVRVAQVARSADWAKLEYENQRAGQSLVWLSQPPAVVGVSSRGVSRLDAFGLSAKLLGGGILFHRKGPLENHAVLELVDLHGRTVWTGAFAPGSSRLAWDGNARNGAGVSSGLYVARLTLLNPQGQAVQVVKRKVPYAR